MRCNQTWKLLYGKGTHQQCENATYWMGENIYIWCDWQRVNIQNIQAADTTQ